MASLTRNKRSASAMEGEYQPSTQDFNDEMDEGSDVDVSQIFTQTSANNKRKKHYMTQMDDDVDDVEDGDPSTAGIISRIVLHNFMCHDFFELDLGPQLNFIIGHNGSGKSAILTGISVCLGAKASDTNRGTSIRSLIKDGKSTARVSVTIQNHGDHAYEPEVFGNKIIIERRLQRTGATASSYFIRSEAGKTISTKKALLEEILLKFNIPIDNPLAFLSQDKAREFLTSSNDNQKFSYFMSGTLINDTIEQYNATHDNISEVKEKLKLSRADCELLQQQYNSVQAVYSKHRKNRHLREKLKMLHGKVYWIRVHSLEQKIQEYRNRIEEYKQGIVAANKEIADCDEFISYFENSKEKARLEVTMTEGDHEKINGEYTSFREQLMKLKEDITQYNESIKQNEKEIKENEKEINNTNKQIDDEQSRIDAINGGSRSALSDKLAVMKSRQEELKAKVASLREEKLNLTSSLETDKYDLRQDLNESKASIQQWKSNLLGIQQRQKDKFAAFGNQMNRVIHQINQSGNMFSQPPIGPIGAHVSIKSGYEEWEPVINTILNKQLDSFLVSTSQDRQSLERILRQNNVHKGIVVRRPTRFDYSGGMPGSVSTVIDALDFEVEDIKFALIDISHIENIVIEPDRERAASLIRMGDRNIGNVLSLLKDRSGAQRSSGSNGNFRIDPVHFRNDLTKLSSVNGASVESELADTRRKIEEQERRRQEIENNLKEIDARYSLRGSRLDREVQELSSSLKRLDKQIYDLEAKLSEEADYARLETLKDNKLELEKENEVKIRAVEALQIEVASKEEKYNGGLDILKQKRKQLKEFEAVLEGKKEALARLDADKNIRESNKAHYLQSIKKRETRIESDEGTMVEFQGASDEFSSKGSQFCVREEARLMEGDTDDSVLVEFNAAEQAVAQAESALGKPFDQVLEELKIASTKLDEGKEKDKSLTQVYKDLHEKLKVRISSMESVIDFWTMEASASFSSSLKLRGFQGDLEFDFKNKKLTMKVQTPKDKEKRTIESLSGGEKSFTQIALLLAIWKPMRSRIRGLDEFDVYMDSVNRAIGIKLLLKELRKYPNSQSIFITPQDIADIADVDSDDVKIHRIKDPRRVNNSENH